MKVEGLDHVLLILRSQFRLESIRYAFAFQLNGYVKYMRQPRRKNRIMKSF